MPSFDSRTASSLALVIVCALIVPACTLSRSIPVPDQDGDFDAAHDDAEMDDGGIDSAIDDTGIDAAMDDVGIDSGTDAWVPSPDGTTCTGPDTCASGFCVDGVCCESACEGTCESCTAGVDGRCSPYAAGSDPDSECAVETPESCGSTGVCDGARKCTQYGPSTVCEPSSCTDGTQTNPHTCDGAGTCADRGTTVCAPFTCDGSVCFGNCASDADCTGGTYCVVATGSCEPTLANGTACTAGNQCASGECVDGVCCNGACRGACEACANALTGVIDGTCSPVTAATDPDDDCSASSATSCGTTGLCDGAGTCSLWASGTECGAASCAGGIATAADACDGAGVCVDHGLTACAPYTCSGTACRTTCTAPSDCAAGNYCEGGACVPLRTLGQVCASSASCGSGFCVDGVCCNGACSGTCSACTAALKGAGSDGTCGNIAAGTDPSNECTTQAASTCGTTGMCSGSGSCQLYVIGTTCGAASCTSGTETRATTCDGTGTCLPPTTAACMPYTCGATACRTSCSLDAHCIAGDFCSSGTCVPTRANGAACIANNQCGSGQCVDGVCCNSACGGTCLACNVAGSVGTCSSVPLGQIDTGTCTGGFACDGTGTCLGTNGSVCAFDGSCLSGNCVDGVCCSTACSGTCEACNIAGSIGACAAIPAGTDPANECAGVLSCDGSGACES